MDNQLLENEIALTGMSADEIRSVARRQLAGSIVAGLVIAAAAVLMAFKPAYKTTAETKVTRTIVVSQPILVAAPGQRLATAAPHQIELP